MKAASHKRSYISCSIHRTCPDRQIRRDRKRLPGAGRSGGNGERLRAGMESLLRAMKISKIDCSNVAQTKYTKTHQTVYFKRVYCMAGEFYLKVILRNEEMVYVFFLQLRNQRFSDQRSAIKLSGPGIFPWLILSKFLNCFYSLFKMFVSLLMSFQQN